ncbi:hypothetical protein QR680_000948 [Steinernema hermaphroditum]|uniref:Uncharacterized protein n=1 Tax=Steinernema hermaphroditum TaxID=289476 RepID=A0AA39GZ77_9BILA|nr:hypothetical protein QR680_000948 [Steinernema hermaphroditum]
MNDYRWWAFWCLTFQSTLSVIAVDYDYNARYTDLTNLGTSMSRRPSSLLAVPRYDWAYQAPAVPSYIPNPSSNIHFNVPSSVFDVRPSNNFFARMAHDVMNKVISTVAGPYGDDTLFPMYQPSPPERVQPTTRLPEKTGFTDVLKSVKITVASSTHTPLVSAPVIEDSYFVQGLKRNPEARHIFTNIERYANPQVGLEEYLDGVAKINPKILKYEKPEIRFSPRKKYTYKVPKHHASSENYERVFPTTSTPNPPPNLFERKAVEYFVGQSLSPRLVIDSLPERVATTAVPIVDRNTVESGSDDHPVRILPRRRSKHEKTRLMWMHKIHRALDSYQKHQKQRKSRKHRRTVHLPMRYE